jgi:putative DNA primase/helicase
LLGTDLVASRAIGFFVDNRFSMGSLFGKLMLLDDDVSAGTRLPDGFLKVISEAKTVTGEWKHGPTFDFQVRSVPVLLCNNYPSLADVSEGIQRRLMVVPFDKAFKGKEKDIGIFERIWANEMPGVLNRALEGLARLRQRGSKFKLPKDLLRANKKFLMEANPLPNFIDEMCTPSISGGTYLKEFYKAYEEWCQQSGITMKQQRSRVKQNLLQLGYKTGRGNKGPKVMGLKLNSTGL